MRVVRWLHIVSLRLDLIEVVGVVQDAKYFSLRDAHETMVYIPYSQDVNRLFRMCLAVRTVGDPREVVRPIREALRAVDGDVPIGRIDTGESRLTAGEDCDLAGRPRTRHLSYVPVFVDHTLRDPDGGRPYGPRDSHSFFRTESRLRWVPTGKILRETEVMMSASRVAKQLALVLLVSAYSPAVGWARQQDQSAADMASRTDVTVGVTMQTPTDVDLPPLCVNLSLRCGSPRTFPDFGGALSVATYLHENVAIVGEASVFDNLWYSSPAKEGKHDNIARLLMAGIRVRVAPPAVGGRKAQGVRLFGQVLAGTEWTTVLSARHAIQPGAGIDARFASGRVVRIQLDYSLVPGTGRNLSGARVFIGMVYGL